MTLLRRAAFRPTAPATAAGGGGGPTGSAGGSLAGTYPNPSIAAGAIGATELAVGAVDVSTTKATGVLAAGRFPALTGDVTTSAGALATTIGAAKVVASMMAASAVDLSTSVATGILAAARMPALTGDVTNSAGALATTIANGAVTTAKMANMAALTIRGNNTTSAAAPADLTVAQAQALLRAGAQFSPALHGTLLAGSGDPIMFGINTNPLLNTAATTYMLKVWLPPGTYTNYAVYCQTVGNTLAATTYCFYICNADATGTVVANTGSADASAVWLTTGIQAIGLGTPLVTTVGAYYWIITRTGTATTQPKTGAIPTALGQLGGANNVAPNAANAPRWGVATNAPTGITPTATGNVLTANAQCFPVWLT